MNRSQWLLTAACAGSFASAACGGGDVPAQRLADSEATLRAARQANAEKLPSASLHVQLADENMQKAQKLMKSGDNHQADRYLRRAKADAELALALAESESSAVTAAEAQKKVQALQQQTKNN